jgi:hypothetical protein
MDRKTEHVYQLANLPKIMHDSNIEIRKRGMDDK